MRKIKFRHWNIDKNKIYEGGTERGNLRIIEESILCGYVLMQCTGLTDKNKKEIYEGDVLKLVYDGIRGDKRMKNVLVEFKNGGFGIEANEFIFLSKLNVLSMEVIGNTYENKELLK